ncbi:LIP-domain-containing protein [Meira miltonrushii]|uniref:triacylglycerol lipase n=1 Tax=Meira miltonrushii TaxID=1280837 RepID=A0A316VM70_9BASI|nr:LIP-domain-containing protein [Meira miltonrushii]PWN36665.1 LIP-domain-containing protein [Meira miltonrushii]
MENGLQKESGVQAFWLDAKARFGFKSTREPLPRNDPFYGCNSTVEELKKGDYSPGALLRKRGIYLTDFIDFDADEMIGWQMAYITRGQDAKDDVMVTVATIVIPPNAGARDKIVFQMPKTDSANSNSRTSYMLRRGSGSIAGAASEQIFMIDFLKRGYIVVVVDYEGQFDAFGAGPTAGHGALDAMRAILSFDELKLAPKDQLKFVGWGYSGGAIAISWAAQMLESYASDLQPYIKGWSCGGVPKDLKQVAYHVNNGLAAGLIIGVMQGLANINKTLNDWLQANTNEYGKKALEVAKTESFWDFMPQNAFKDILNMVPGGTGKDAGYFTVEGDALSPPPPKEALEFNQLALEFTKTKDKKLIPKVPIFLYERIPDEVVPIAIIDDLVDLWSSNGAIIQYTRVKVWMHVGAIFAMQSQNVAWIADRMDGKPIEAKDAYKKDLDTNIDDKESEAVLGKERCGSLAKFYNTIYGKPKRVWW